MSSSDKKVQPLPKPVKFAFGGLSGLVGVELPFLEINAFYVDWEFVCLTGWLRHFSYSRLIC